MQINELHYAKNYGPLLRSLLNGVKHTAGSFANLHGLDAAELEEIMAGNRPLNAKVLKAVENHGPLTSRLLIDPKFRHNFPVNDDTDDGVIVFSSHQRQQTERTFNRGPNKIPFYVYADTAMSKTSPFRPEWIRELYVDQGLDQNIPDWAFNHGHFEYQMTYFIGTVNFYWKDKDGKKHVRQMNTGDTNYITPFVPHTFATRKEGEGLILAVTYGGSVSKEDFQSRIHSMSVEQFQSWLAGEFKNVPYSSMLSTDELNGVIIRRHGNSKTTGLETVLLDEVPYQPHTRALEYSMNQDTASENLKTESERWGYNAGDSLIFLKWGANEHHIEPGASFFIRPGVLHSFRSSGANGKIVVMEIKPEGGDPIKDLSLIYRYSGHEGISRVHSETKQWF